MAALKRIQLKGFRSIKEMDLELRPLNVMIGAHFVCPFFRWLEVLPVAPTTGSSHLAQPL